MEQCQQAVDHVKSCEECRRRLQLEPDEIKTDEPELGDGMYRPKRHLLGRLANYREISPFGR